MKLRILTTVAVALGFAALGLYFSTIYAAKPQPSDDLYLSKLPTVPAQPNDAAKSLGEYRNTILVVNFWATWCGPCVKEMPALSALQTELAPKKIKFIGIGIDNADDMATFAKKYQIAYPLYVAGMAGTKLSSTMGNAQGGLPFTIILNKSGAIVKTYRGALDIDKLRADILAIR